jgi:hypothetical protein
VKHSVKQEYSGSDRHQKLLISNEVMVEVHGRQHYHYDSHYHKSLADYKKKQKVDQEKREYALSLGYKFIEVDYREHIPELALERFIHTFNLLPFSN